MAGYIPKPSFSVVEVELVEENIKDDGDKWGDVGYEREPALMLSRGSPASILSLVSLVSPVCEYPDLTPKPLNIVKRPCRRTSTSHYQENSQLHQDHDHPLACRQSQQHCYSGSSSQSHRKMDPRPTSQCEAPLTSVTHQLPFKRSAATAALVIPPRRSSVTTSTTSMSQSELFYRRGSSSSDQASMSITNSLERASPVSFTPEDQLTVRKRRQNDLTASRYTVLGSNLNNCHNAASTGKYQVEDRGAHLSTTPSSRPLASGNELPDHGLLPTLELTARSSSEGTRYNGDQRRRPYNSDPAIYHDTTSVVVRSFSANAKDTRTSLLRRRPKDRSSTLEQASVSSILALREDVQRKPSMRARALSRFLGRLGTMTKSRNLLTVANDSTGSLVRQSRQNTATAHQIHSAAAKEETSSSGKGTSSMGDDVTVIFSERPSTPTPSFYSETIGPLNSSSSCSTTDSEFSGRTALSRMVDSFPSPPRATRSCAPAPVTASSQNAVVTAEIKVVPEHESLCSNVEQSVWTAVEIRADVNMTPLSSVRPDSRCALNTVVCIDVSAYTSPAAFTACREISLLIASLLDPNKDRLAIVSSSPECSAHVALPLHPVSLELTREALERIERPNPTLAPTSINIEEGLHACACLLSRFKDRSRQESFSEGDVAQASSRGHIMLLASHISNVPLDGNIYGFPVHVINPAVTPWKTEPSNTSGWQLRSLLPFRLGSPAFSNGDDSLARRLRKILDHARSGAIVGQMRDVRVEVKAGRSCRIEAVLGKSRQHCLVPGETMQLFVKLRIDPAPTQTLLGHQSERAKDTMAQLDAILGESMIKLIDIRVRYKHTLFPPHTTLSTQTTCSINRCSSPSPWSRARSPLKLNGNDHPAHQLQKGLGFFIATRQSPKRAVADLKLIFGEALNKTVSPAYLRQVEKELIYQATITERFQFDVSDDLEEGFLDSFANSFEDFSTTAGRVMADISNERVLSRTASPSSAAASRKILKHAASKISLDDARKIWHQMRKVSRSSTDGGAIDPDLDLSDSKLIEIAEIALKNKRSLGQDTLKSIALADQPSGPCGPWL